MRMHTLFTPPSQYIVGLTPLPIKCQCPQNRLHKTNNFPEFTGLVCPAPCEGG